MNSLTAALAVMFLLCRTVAGQGTSKDSHEISLIAAVDRIPANNNEPETIGKEILNPVILHQIGETAGLSDEDLSTVSVEPGPTNSSIILRQLGDSDMAFRKMDHQLWWYIYLRTQGHTTSFFLASSTNRLHPSTVTDPELRALLKEEPLLPPELIKKWETGSYTNNEPVWTWISTNARLPAVKQTNSLGEVVHWARYVIVDGEVAWLYQASLKPRQRPFVDCVRYDAKDFDPKYHDVLLKAEEDALDSLKKNSDLDPRTWGRPLVQRLKQEKLRSLGINWRTPGELNPQEEKQKSFR